MAESSVYYTLRVLSWNFVPLDPFLSVIWHYSPLVTAQQTRSEMKMDFCSRKNRCKIFPNIAPTSNSFTFYQEILSQTVEGTLGRRFPEREENALLHQYLHLWHSKTLAVFFYFDFIIAFGSTFLLWLYKKIKLSIILLQKWRNCKAESIWLWKLLFN